MSFNTSILQQTTSVQTAFMNGTTIIDNMDEELKENEKPVRHIDIKNANNSLKLEFQFDNSRNTEINELPSVPSSAGFNSIGKKNGSFISMGR